MGGAETDQPARNRVSSRNHSLMFTDIEGSTSLLQDLGDGYSTVLMRHHAIIREATKQFHGVEQDTQGDAFFILFDRAEDAFAAAVTIQRALESERWPHGIVLRVRIGLHEGVVKKVDNECIGLDVHRAARICSAGNGGQTVFSTSIHRSLSSDSIEGLGVQVRPLGRHRLKDIRYPETLFDIDDPTTGIEFPTLRTLGTRRTNIADPRGPIVGRDSEIADLIRLLAEGRGRIVTIVGAGGTGKSTVAERIAALTVDDYPDGTYFVDLGPVTESGLVFPTIAQTLGIRDFPGRPVEHDIAAAIGDGRQLLILDTFEHLLDAVPGLAQLAATCNNLRILVTSRAELGLSSESSYLLGPLALPASGDPEPESSGAMRLFVDRIREVDGDFAVDGSNRETIAEIVTRLEGVPLALELAAARLSLMTPAQLLGRLDARFKLLRGSRQSLGRHRTLRDAIEWSDNLLAEDERDVFQRLSVFVGGFKLEDAENVLNDIDDIDADVLDAIASLVSKSLLYRRLENGEPRFAMYDMVREYAAETLDSRGNLDETETAFLGHFISVAEECGAMAMHRNQRAYVVRLIEEADNIRAALRLAIGGANVEATARLVKAMHWYWISQGLFTEGLRWIEQASELADRHRGSAASATVHFAATYTKACAGDYAGGVPHGHLAKSIFEELGDEDSAKEAALIHALCAAGSGEMEDPSGIILDCIDHLRARGDHYSSALGYIILGEGTRMEGDTETAENCYAQALELLEKIKNTFWPGLLKQNIAHFRLASGKPEEAAALLSEAYDLGEEYDYPIVTHLCVAGFGGVALARGDARTAARLLGGVEHHLKKIGASFEPTDKADIDKYIAGAREKLGDAAYAECADAGTAARWEELRAEARALAGESILATA